MAMIRCDPPCGDCENKGCGAYHSQCEEYQSWSKQRAEVKRKIDEENNAIYHKLNSLHGTHSHDENKLRRKGYNERLYDERKKVK